MRKIQFTTFSFYKHKLIVFDYRFTSSIHFLDCNFFGYPLSQDRVLLIAKRNPTKIYRKHQSKKKLLIEINGAKKL